jgi:hypothetical protein
MAPAALTEKKQTPEISAEELARRMAVLKRFRELLKTQRDRFAQYLETLDRQKNVIEQGQPESLEAHVALEETILADIFSLQKVIDPLEDLYREVYPLKKAIPRKGLAAPEASSAASDIPDLKSSLESLKAQAIIRVRENKELLSKRMLELRQEIKTLKSNPFARNRSPYGSTPAPSMIDIQG